MAYNNTIYILWNFGVFFKINNYSYIGYVYLKLMLHTVSSLCFLNYKDILIWGVFFLLKSWSTKEFVYKFVYREKLRFKRWAKYRIELLGVLPYIFILITILMCDHVPHPKVFGNAWIASAQEFP